MELKLPEGHHIHRGAIKSMYSTGVMPCVIWCHGFFTCTYKYLPKKPKWIKKLWEYVTEKLCLAGCLAAWLNGLLSLSTLSLYSLYFFTRSWPHSLLYFPVFLYGCGTKWLCISLRHVHNQGSIQKTVASIMLIQCFLVLPSLFYPSAGSTTPPYTILNESK